MKPKTEIMRQTPWSRIRGQNSVSKEVWEIVGSGKPTGNVPKETIAVSVTISISVQNRHSRIFLRDLLRSRVWEMHREPEVLEAEANVGKWLDCRARITSKELAPLHSVRNGILQNACSTSPKRDAGLGKSALMRIARLKNSQAKGLKRMVTKSAVAMLKITRQLGCVFQDMEPPKSSPIFAEELKHTETNPMCSIH